MFMISLIVQRLLSRKFNCRNAKNHLLKSRDNKNNNKNKINSKNNINNKNNINIYV